MLTAPDEFSLSFSGRAVSAQQNDLRMLLVMLPSSLLSSLFPHIKQTAAQQHGLNADERPCPFQRREGCAEKAFEKLREEARNGSRKGSRSWKSCHSCQVLCGYWLWSNLSGNEFTRIQSRDHWVPRFVGGYCTKKDRTYLSAILHIVAGPLSLKQVQRSYDAWNVQHFSWVSFTIASLIFSPRLMNFTVMSGLCWIRSWAVSARPLQESPKSVWYPTKSRCAGKATTKTSQFQLVMVQHLSESMFILFCRTWWDNVIRFPLCWSEWKHGWHHGRAEQLAEVAWHSAPTAALLAIVRVCCAVWWRCSSLGLFLWLSAFFQFGIF